MMLVRTNLAPSKIHGIGLFADRPIKKGRIVWKFNPVIDRKIAKDELGNLPLSNRVFINTYAFFDTGFYILCGDNARFFNHSNNPNCGSRGEDTIALRDIKIGEELTDNYNDYEKPVTTGR